MNERYFILSLAKKQIEKQLEKSEKDMKKQSEKLWQAHKDNTTIRRRSMLRVKARCAAEERDRWIMRLSEVERWMEEVKDANRGKQGGGKVE